MSRLTSITLSLSVLIVGWAAGATAKEDYPYGTVAASVGEQVVLLDPSSGRTALFTTGPVGWLYPGPAGALFAPDLVNGRTTILDSVSGGAPVHLDGVSMPNFGPFADRYAVVTRTQVLLISYPDRAPMFEVDVEIGHPWQVKIPVDGSSMLILDRQPDGEGGAALAAIDLINRKVVYHSPLPGDVVRMAPIPELGLLALADAGSQAVRLIDPRTRLEAFARFVKGSPRDLAAAGDGRILATAVEGNADDHQLILWKLRSKKDTLKIKKQWSIPLPAPPSGVAVDPTGRWVAVGLTSSALAVVDTKEEVIVQITEIPGPPRHVVWCDPSIAGPVVERWSDRGGQMPNLNPKN